ncbi:hypothetical protein BASA81_002307 [Batrachochytrium salamandrivorans]|nr:hypothetical protein BASA81_002307 [Batrachochytrium salamandrivorans]
MLANKFGLVFGASSKYSLGFQVGRAWIQAQSSGVVLACESDDLCAKIKREAQKEGWWSDETCRVVQCDVNVDEDLLRVCAQIGVVDMALHSVAFAPKSALHQPVLALGREDFKQTMETSAYSLLAVARHAQFNPLGASLTSLTFAGSHRVLPGYGAMAPAKAALETLSLYLASELGPRGVRVNCISPGPINTPAARAIPGFHSLLGASKDRTALKRPIAGNEVGAAAVFLASELASGVTGQVIKVDCGDAL